LDIYLLYFTKYETDNKIKKYLNQVSLFYIELRTPAIEHLKQCQHDTYFIAGLEKACFFSKKPKNPVLGFFWSFCSKFNFKHITLGCFLSGVGFWAEKS
jgi:hypothetical protein